MSQPAPTQTDDVSIRLQSLDGTWETIGVDRLAGVYPELDSLDLSANSWGSDKASFNLHRDPGTMWPDLSAWTPIEVEVGGEVVWSGRISETPTTEGDDRVINVQAEGWQYHLDDDLYDKAYVHTNLGDWVDIRSLPSADLNQYRASLNVSSEAGSIALQAPANTALVNVTGAGVLLDLGPNNSAARIVVTYSWVNNTANGNMQFACWAGSNDPHSTSPNGSSVFQAALTTGTGNTVRAAALPAGTRWIKLHMISVAGGDFTPTGELQVKITGVQVFASSAYESGNASILKAPDVVKDALTHAPLLSADQSGIGTASFNIPEFTIPVAAPQTPREAWSAANAFHNYISKIDVEKRPVFKARPSAPKYEIGAWAGSEFQDASANSGDDIYNKVMVTGTSPDGAPVSVVRYAGALETARVQQLTSLKFINGTFEDSFSISRGQATSDGGWSLGASDTDLGETFQNFLLNGFWRGQFNYGNSPGPSAWTAVLTGNLTGDSFKAGLTYVVVIPWWAIGGGGGAIPQPITVDLLNGASVVSTSTIPANPPRMDDGANPTFSNLILVWTPSSDVPASNVHVRFTAPSPVGQSGTLYIDNLYVGTSAPTLADLRNFYKTKNLPIQSPLTTVVAQQIGDVWLGAHLKTPFKGSLAAHGHGAVREVLTGAPVHPAHILRDTGELIRLSDRIDPDTGGIGRDGLIANVRYTHADRKAQIDLDSGRENVEAFLSRLAVVTGSALGQ